MFGHGNPDADLMFVAEGPGYHDDRTGSMFSGPAGLVLDQLLAGIGMSRDDVYATSVVKCRPPRNRTPFPDEIEQCEGYLFQQITRVRPRVVCPLGNVALRLLTGRPLRIADVHGRVRKTTVQGRPISVFPLYHPAAAGYAEPLLAVLRADFRSLPRLLRGSVDVPPGGHVAQQPGAPASAADAPGHAADGATPDVAPQLSFDIDAAPA